MTVTEQDMNDVLERLTWLDDDIVLVVYGTNTSFMTRSFGRIVLRGSVESYIDYTFKLHNALMKNNRVKVIKPFFTSDGKLITPKG